MDIENWKRRLVLVATDVQADGLEHDKVGLELLRNQEVTILPIKQADIFDTQFTLLGSIRPQPGMLLLMSPYDDNTYVEASNARSLIAIEKASLTLRFCSLLGAKSVKVKNIKICDTENLKELTIDAQNNTISGSLNGKKSEIENIKNQIQVNAIFAGGIPNFEKAEKLLRSSRLISDSLFKNLFEMVRDSQETNNKIIEITQEVSLTQSLQKTFEIIAKINFPAGFVSGNFNSIVKEKIEIYLSLVINF